MKKRIFSMILALVMTMGLGAAAFAATEEPEPTPEPEYRLVSVKVRSSDGQSDRDFIFSYDNGGWLPSAYEALDPYYTGPSNGSPVTLASPEEPSVPGHTP